MSDKGVVLLVEHHTGDVMAVRFRTREEARDWEDEHLASVTVLGLCAVVTKREALSS